LRGKYSVERIVFLSPSKVIGTIRITVSSGYSPAVAVSILAQDGTVSEPAAMLLYPRLAVTVKFQDDMSSAALSQGK